MFSASTKVMADMRSNRFRIDMPRYSDYYRQKGTEPRRHVSAGEVETFD